MRHSMSRVTSRGALAPTISTAPITRSASATVHSTLYRLDATVLTRPPKTSSRRRSRSRSMSRTVTSAPMPAATLAALVPTTPAPRIVTLPGSTPATPARRTPRPPDSFSSALAPAWMLIRPATSLIGVRSGRVRSGSSMVS